MLAQQIKAQLAGIVSRDRYLDRPEELACYSYDAFNDEAMPDAVVFPVTTEEVRHIVQIAARHKIPLTARGAGTSVCGASIPIKGGIVTCFSKMNRILEVNTRDRYIIVQPGVVNAEVQKALAPFGFFYPPDPGSMNTATIGGNVAMNAGGPRCLKYGVTVDYVLGLEVVLASGKVIKFGSRNVKDVTGYKLSALFCGSEGTLGLVTEVILKVMPIPETVKTLLVTFDDLNRCGTTVSDIIGAGIIPASLELLDKLTLNTIEDFAKLGFDRKAEGTLLIEVDGVAEACEKEVTRIMEILKRNKAVNIQEAKDQADRDRLWAARRSANGVFAKLAPSFLSEDVTVPVSKVPAMIRACTEITTGYGLRIGILAHAGDGNLHPMIPGDSKNKEEYAKIHKAFDDIYRVAADMGGTLSGEHGIGNAKAPYLPLVMNQDTIEFLSTIKRAVDPDNILNPGKFA